MTTLISRILGFLGFSFDQLESELLAKNLKVGGLYSIIHDEEEGTFRVVKILVLEPSTVHLCIYANTFLSRPEHIDPTTLSLGGLDVKNLESDTEELDISGCGIGHLPLPVKGFVQGWQPIFLADFTVTDEDLEGYKMWKEGGGGVFGKL